MDKSLLFLACILISFIMISIAQETPQQFVAKGDASIRQGQFKLAIDHFTSAIEIEPSLLAYFKRAIAYLGLSNSNSARKDLLQVLKINPSFYQARYKLAELMTSSGQFTESDVELDILIKSHQSESNAQALKIKNQECLHKYDRFNSLKAEERCESDLKKDLTECSPQWKSHLDFVCRCELNRIESDPSSVSQATYRTLYESAGRLLKVDPSLVEALYWRGLAAFNLNLIDVAIGSFRDSLRMDPDHSKSQKFHKRIRNFQKLKNNSDQLVSQNKWKDAVEPLTSLLELFPESNFVNLPIVMSLCKAYKETKKLAEATETCERAINMAEREDAKFDQIEAKLTLAEAKLAMGEWDIAINDFQQINSFLHENQNELNSINGQLLQNIQSRLQQGSQQAERSKKIASKKDHYKTLGIRRDASDVEIRKAYRKLAIEWHPDKHLDEEKKDMAAKRYMEITEAYEILNDEEKKGRYDRGEDLDEVNGGHHHGFNGFHGFQGFNQGGFTFTFQHG